MNIGSVHFEKPTVLAPLAGITNLPFRLLAKEAGCGLVCSEMISSNALVYKNAKTRQMLNNTLGEKPLSIQIFGSNPAIMAEAAAMVESAGADILDINFGCSVKKVLKTGSGAALMRTPETAKAVVQSVRKAIRIPLTLKIRSGWEPSGRQAVTIARMAQECGVDAVAVHPRTAPQGFGGKADWSIIRTVKQEITIPVIGNGDIVRPEDAMEMRDQTGCDAVMVGRAAIGNPWIFSQIDDLFNARNPQPVSPVLRAKMMIRYLNDSVIYFGETHACRMMRSRLGWFVKGLPGCGRFRESIKAITTASQAQSLIRAYFSQLSQKFSENNLPG